MKAIVTKFHGPGSVRGSRISAKDSDRNMVMITLNPEWSHDFAHRAAATALCKKMKWHGWLVQGHLGPNSEVFVWSISGEIFQV